MTQKLGHLIDMISLQAKDAEAHQAQTNLMQQPGAKFGHRHRYYSVVAKEVEKHLTWFDVTLNEGSEIDWDTTLENLAFSMLEEKSLVLPRFIVDTMRATSFSRLWAKDYALDDPEQEELAEAQFKADKEEWDIDGRYGVDKAHEAMFQILVERYHASKA